MTPSGCISVQEAIDLIGREKFGPDWIGQEHSARSGLYSVERWNELREKPAMSGSGAALHNVVVPKFNRLEVEPRNDPTSDVYQAERAARERFDSSREELIRRLEAGEWAAIIVDPWSGQRHDAGRNMWRTGFADRYLDKKRAKMPYSANEGMLYILSPKAEQRKPVVPQAVLNDDYISPYITLMLEATRKFKIKERSFPKQEELQSYFQSLRLPDGSPISERLAKSMATLCRPPTAMKGGNKRTG